MNKKHKRSTDYHDGLIEELKNHNEAVAYLMQFSRKAS
jgi:hypothetical protein